LKRAGQVTKAGPSRASKTQSQIGLKTSRVLKLSTATHTPSFGCAAAIRLRSIAASEDSAFESERRARFAEKLDSLRRERIAHPQVLVEAPTAVVNTRLADLPASVEPGLIAVRETDGKRAVEKLLAVAMGIGNQFDEFDQILSGR
jgi:hypothetical protein